MGLTPPNLDDRRFDDLVVEALQRIEKTCPEWNDLSPGDPGVVLLEVFAYLTDVLLYRVNRLPEKIYIELLRLIGVELQAPSAASVNLQFTLSRERSDEIEIPRGTRVTSQLAGSNKESPIFITTDSAKIMPGKTSVTVNALHCEFIEGELLGYGTGLPGQNYSVKMPPIIAPSTDGMDLIVGVEIDPEEVAETTAARRYGDKAFRIWRQVDNFADLKFRDHFQSVDANTLNQLDKLTKLVSTLKAKFDSSGDTKDDESLAEISLIAEALQEKVVQNDLPASDVQDRFVYTVNRLEGTIVFAPAIHEPSSLIKTSEALAEVPKEKREIRVWYRRGGGTRGNLPRNTLTVIKDKLSGIEVNNPFAATGGGDAETLENALIRGPQELHSLHRAVTARDFELLAKRSSRSVNRAYAYTKSMLWSYAKEGTVEVLMVPEVSVSDNSGPITQQMLFDQQSDVAINQVQAAVNKCKPLGTHCNVSWAKTKTVKVISKIFVLRQEDANAVRQRVLNRLWSTINPLVDYGRKTNRGFGQHLAVWDVYKIIGEEPGVSLVDLVKLEVDHVPDKKIYTLCADEYQENTWYSGSEESLFRSINNGMGWERLNVFENQEIVKIKPFPIAASALKRAGLVAVATHNQKGDGSSIYVSQNCGESWEPALQLTFKLNDIAWTEREGNAVLLLATDTGLFELPPRRGADLKKIIVEPSIQDLGFYSVAVSNDIWTGTAIAVAAKQNKGIFLSLQGGKPDSFEGIELKSELVRNLQFQRYGARRYLWAGTHVPGSLDGNGCYRVWLTSSGISEEGWKHYANGWGDAGNCNAISFNDSIVYAATDRRGILRLDTSKKNEEWTTTKVDCGLPLKRQEKSGHLLPVRTVDFHYKCLFVGGEQGIYRSDEAGEQFENVSSKTFEKVTLPRTWLFCSGDHDIQVAIEDETS